MPCTLHLWCVILIGQSQAIPAIPAIPPLPCGTGHTPPAIPLTGHTVRYRPYTGHTGLPPLLFRRNQPILTPPTPSLPGEFAMGRYVPAKKHIDKIGGAKLKVDIPGWP